MPAKQRIAAALAFAALGALGGCKNFNDPTPVAATVVTPSCDTAAVSYSKHIAPILEKNCLVCHAASIQTGGINLSGYENVKSRAQTGALVGVTSWLPGFPTMPQGGAQLGDCDVAQIRAWVNQGMKNN